MLDVAIVDDEEDVRAELGQMVRRFCAQEGERVCVHEYADGSELLNANGAQAHDVILLDIEMARVDGMDAAHELRRRGVGTQIVFVTNMAQYAIRGCEVGAFDFIVKPVEYPVFAFKFKRVLEAVRARRRDLVTLETRDGFVRMDATDILYVEVRGHKLTYHTTRGPIEIWGTMKAAAAELEPLGFAACNACYLVNLDHVTGLSGEYVRVGEESLKMSRGKSRDFVDPRAHALDGEVAWTPRFSTRPGPPWCASPPCCLPQSSRSACPTCPGARAFWPGLPWPSQPTSFCSTRTCW